MSSDQKSSTNDQTATQVPTTMFEKGEHHFLCNFSIKQICFFSQSIPSTAWIKIKIGHKKFTYPSRLPVTAIKNGETSPTTLWKTQFVVGITPHSFLFSSIIVDVFDRKFFGTRRIYLGRGQVKLAKLAENFDAHSAMNEQHFTLDVRLELHPFRLAPSNSCLLQQKSMPSTSIGYVDLQLLLTEQKNSEDYRYDCIVPQKDVTQIEQVVADETCSPSPTDAEIIDDSQHSTTDRPEEGTTTEQVAQQTQSLHIDGGTSQLDTLFQLNIFKKDNTMRVIQSILREISDGAVFSRRQFLENIVYLQRVYARQIAGKTAILGRQIQNPFEEVGMEEVFRAWNFVIASFGWRGIYNSKSNYSGTFLRLLRHRMLGQYNIKLFETEMIANFLGIDQTDILDLKLFFEDELYKPCYFISNDSKHKAIRLIIRGTMSASDIIMDLLYQFHPWKDSYVHYGMLKAAKWCFNNLAKYLISETMARGYDRVVISGHSLGGAIATLLTVMMIDSESPVKIECVTFGPPPTVTFPVAAKYDDHIKIIINENDLVPQLSFGAVVQLKEIMLACKQPPLDSNCCNAGMYANANDYLKYSKLDRVLENRLQVLQQDIPKLYHLGKIYHILKNTTETGEPFCMYQVPREAYTEACLRKEYLMDHMLNAYMPGIVYFSQPPQPKD